MEKKAFKSLMAGMEDMAAFRAGDLSRGRVARGRATGKMTVKGYEGLVVKEAGEDYQISFPDLPGCFSVGATWDELERNAADAVTLYLEA